MLVISWILLFAVGVASLYLPYVHCYYWRGPWRWLALLPLLLPLGYAAKAMLGMFAEPPEHAINGPLFFGLVILSLLLSLGLRLGYNKWHRRGQAGADDEQA
jgi:hypothetical protein